MSKVPITVETFNYCIEEFGRFMLRAFCGVSDEEIKSQVDVKLSNHPATFRKEVVSLILKLRITHGNLFLHQDDEQRGKYETIYTAMWKMAVYQYDNDGHRMEGLDKSYFHGMINRADELIAQGKITEAIYIDKCNMLKRDREHDVTLATICSCSAMGCYHIHEHEGVPRTTFLRIMVIPCQWHGASKSIKFA